jgi:aminopeptidase N
MPKSVKRLFDQFVPEHYDLSLNLDPKKMEFSGRVKVTGNRTGKPSRRITLHQNGLTITRARVHKTEKGKSNPVKIDRINHHASFDEVRLHSDQMLYPGQYEIELEFGGAITKQMNGMYPCYFKIGSEEHMLIATQFESHHAREVFPCIDEPEAKATFDLSVSAPSGKTIVSNTNIKKQQTKSAKTTTQFETTPRMSTYLLAFVYGELDYLEAKTKDGVLVRTYATPENVAYTQFALDMSVSILEFYNEYFAIDYPLDKCDFSRAGSAG